METSKKLCRSRCCCSPSLPRPLLVPLQPGGSRRPSPPHVSPQLTCGAHLGRGWEMQYALSLAHSILRSDPGSSHKLGGGHTAFLRNPGLRQPPGGNPTRSPWWQRALLVSSAGTCSVPGRAWLVAGLRITKNKEGVKLKSAHHLGSWAMPSRWDFLLFS